MSEKRYMVVVKSYVMDPIHVGPFTLEKALAVQIAQEAAGEFVESATVYEVAVAPKPVDPYQVQAERAQAGHRRIVRESYCQGWRR